MSGSLNADLVLTSSSSIREISTLLRGTQPSRELKKFYSHLRTHCLLVSDHVARIRSALLPGNELIIRILDIFESLIVALQTPQETQKDARCTHPRQSALNHCWHKLRNRSQAARVEFAHESMNVEKFTEQQFRQQFEEEIDLWEEDLISKYPEDDSNWTADDRSPPKTRPEPSYTISGVAHSVFKALTGCTKCECHQTHELDARLCLGTYRKPDLDNTDDFDIFLSLRQVLQKVHVNAVRKSVVQFAINGEILGAPPKLGYKPMPVKKLCNEIHKMQSKISQRLELKVEKDQLFKLRSKDSCFQVDREKPPISLQQLINQDSRPLTEKTKRILAVLLSYAVLHLHGTPWLQPTWDSSKILFFQTSSSTIPLRPFIQTDLAQEIVSKGACDKESGNQYNKDVFNDDFDPDDFDPDDLDPDDIDPDDFEHPFPALVSLAILLMELYFATPFDVLERNRGFELPQGTESCKRSLDVASIFDKYKREIPQNSPFYYAIEKCLDPRTWENETGQRLDDEMLRVTVYEEITRPLEDDLCDAFTFITMEDLDKIAEQVDQYRQLAGPRAGAQQPLFVALNWYPNSPGLSRPLTPNFEYEAAKFYDDEISSETHSPAEVEKYLYWKEKYQAVYRSCIDPYLQGPPQLPVKIAVLDSGADESHNALDTGQIKLKRNWTSKFKKAVHDHDGHGTFTASLIVDYAPDAELYIAKIADRELSPPGVVAEAIKCAVDDWGVDVISMSFGYPTNQVDGYGELEGAILYAHSKNVLVFAAASNSGANLDRAYPARDPHVICVHATDSDGNRSKFSPTALAHDLNIATIGEAVQSAWPVSLCDTRTNPECVQYKSGTSYATPIAVGIAAFLLQYARLHLADQADMLKRQSRMKEVFRKISQKTQQSMSRDGYDYIALSKFSDNLFGKDKNVFYFYYAPTWDWPPEGPIQLGNVLTSVERPEQPLYTAPLPTTDDIFSSDKYEVEYSKEKLREGGFSILTTFLSILGLGVDVGADWKHSNEETYAFKHVETTQFVPKDDYIQKCIEAPAVRAHLERSRYRKPVYIITGLKTVYGAKAKSQTSRSHGGNAAISVDGTVWSGGAVPLGFEPGVEGRRETTQGTSWQDSSDFVFAFRVRKVNVSRKTHAVDNSDDYIKGALLDGKINKLVESVPELVITSQEESKAEDEGYDEDELTEGDTVVRPGRDLEVKAVSELINLLYRPPRGATKQQRDRESPENFKYYGNWGFTIYRTYYAPESDQYWDMLLGALRRQTMLALSHYDDKIEYEDEYGDEYRVDIERLRKLFRLDTREYVSLLDGLDVRGIREICLYEHDSFEKTMAGRMFHFALLADEAVLTDIANGEFVVKAVAYDWEEKGEYWGWMRIPTGYLLELWQSLILGEDHPHRILHYDGAEEGLEGCIWAGDDAVPPTSGCSEVRPWSHHYDTQHREIHHFRNWSKLSR
ncbi:hypothetical protein G7Z17_g3625 [Cylindrodendrum hubeiense]|uniref:Peptidase S8/S53 domain-containing protein n=1 Tax=Cylindrodendrum hubeiense TaxID=595255 RepID=A0A9P5HAI3_9HYPO|nr:hypothetical protein G7Z17_g3625 [Cylindrodendrum hubeiense]